MRILIQSINFSPELTGIGKYTGEMAEWLAARGHEVRVVTTPPHYPQWRVFPGYSAWRFSREALPAPGATGTLEVFRCPVWVPTVPRSWKRVLHLASFSLASYPAMLRQISWRPDIVLLIAPTLFCVPPALGLARLSGAVAWLHVQDFEVDAAFELRDFSSVRLRRWVQAVERALVRRFKRASAISEPMVQRLSSKGIDPERCSLFPNWVDTSVIYPLPTPSRLRREVGLPEDAVVALYSGSLGKKQGLDLLMEASRRLSSRSDLQFVICTDGPERGTLAQLAKQCHNVMLLPLQPTDRLNELLNLADIHLLPQRADAADLVMPSKLTGMMASGRAVLATASPGTQLATVIEGCGMVTPPGDVDEFVSALVRLGEDPVLRSDLGKNARRYAIDHMSRDEILGRFERSMMIACGHAAPEAQPELAGAGKLPAMENFAMAPGKSGDD